MNVYVAKSHLVVVHLPGDVLQGVQDRVELVDDELGSCEEEGNQEDEQVCHQLLQVHPLPLVREVLPDYIIWRRGVPVREFFENVCAQKCLPDSPFIRSYGNL